MAIRRLTVAHPPGLRDHPARGPELFRLGDPMATAGGEVTGSAFRSADGTLARLVHSYCAAISDVVVPFVADLPVTGGVAAP
jgi:hypothetical protein